MSTKTKTFEECCDEVAKKHGFDDWEDLVSRGVAYFSALTFWNKAVADLYASEKIKRAIELAREKKDLTPNGESPHYVSKYTEQEILERLNQNKTICEKCGKLMCDNFISTGSCSHESIIDYKSGEYNLPSPPKDLNEEK